MNLNASLYLVDVISSLNRFTYGISGLGIITLLVALVGKIFCQDEYIDRRHTFEPLWTSILKKWPVVLVASILTIFIPQETTMYLMLGASYLQESNLPSKVSAALELKLDGYIDELKNGKNKK